MRGDCYRLQQCLLNLLSNAIKFTPPHGRIDVRIDVPSRTLSQAQLRVAVVDTGCGISAEDQRRLFKPFAQALSGPRAHGSGSGLGLSITRRLVELHGGTLHVTSEVGAGSEFTVVLPLDVVEWRQASAAEADSKAAGARPVAAPRDLAAASDRVWCSDGSTTSQTDPRARTASDSSRPRLARVSRAASGTSVEATAVPAPSGPSPSRAAPGNSSTRSRRTSGSVASGVGPPLFGAQPQRSGPTPLAAARLTPSHATVRSPGHGTTARRTTPQAASHALHRTASGGSSGHGQPLLHESSPHGARSSLSSSSAAARVLAAVASTPNGHGAVDRYDSALRAPLRLVDATAVAYHQASRSRSTSCTVDAYDTHAAGAASASAISKALPLASRAAPPHSPEARAAAAAFRERRSPTSRISSCAAQYHQPPSRYDPPAVTTVMRSAAAATHGRNALALKDEHRLAGTSFAPEPLQIPPPPARLEAVATLSSTRRSRVAPHQSGSRGGIDRLSASTDTGVSEDHALLCARGSQMSTSTPTPWAHARCDAPATLVRDDSDSHSYYYGVSSRSPPARAPNSACRASSTRVVSPPHRLHSKPEAPPHPNAVAGAVVAESWADEHTYIVNSRGAPVSAHSPGMHYASQGAPLPAVGESASSHEGGHGSSSRSRDWSSSPSPPPRDRGAEVADRADLPEPAASNNSAATSALAETGWRRSGGGQHSTGAAALPSDLPINGHGGGSAMPPRRVQAGPQKREVLRPTAHTTSHGSTYIQRDAHAPSTLSPARGLRATTMSWLDVSADGSDGTSLLSTDEALARTRSPQLTARAGALPHPARNACARLEHQYYTIASDAAAGGDIHCADGARTATGTEQPGTQSAVLLGATLPPAEQDARSSGARCRSGSPPSGTDPNEPGVSASTSSGDHGSASSVPDACIAGAGAALTTPGHDAAPSPADVNSSCSGPLASAGFGRLDAEAEHSRPAANARYTAAAAARRRGSSASVARAAGRSMGGHVPLYAHLHARHSLDTAAESGAAATSPTSTLAQHAQSPPLLQVHSSPMAAAAASPTAVVQDHRHASIEHLRGPYTTALVATGSPLRHGAPQSPAVASAESLPASREFKIPTERSPAAGGRPPMPAAATPAGTSGSGTSVTRRSLSIRSETALPLGGDAPLLTPAALTIATAAAPFSSTAEPSARGSSGTATSDGRVRSVVKSMRLTILVVDDVESNRKLLCRLLKQFDVTTHVATDGMDALAQISARAGVDLPSTSMLAEIAGLLAHRSGSSDSGPGHSPSAELPGNLSAAIRGLLAGRRAAFDVVLLDAEMPKCNGLQAARLLRMMGYSAPVIGVTGNALLRDQHRFLRAGVSAVLTKPVNLDQMLVTIAECVHRHREPSQQLPQDGCAAVAGGPARHERHDALSRIRVRSPSPASPAVLSPSQSPSPSISPLPSRARAPLQRHSGPPGSLPRDTGTVLGPPTDSDTGEDLGATPTRDRAPVPRRSEYGHVAGHGSSSTSQSDATSADGIGEASMTPENDR